MDKNIKGFCLLSIILITISLVVVLVMGRTYDVIFDYKDNGVYKIDSNSSGEVEVVSEAIKDNKYIIKVKAKKPGKVFINYSYDDMIDSKILFIHKTYLITENSYFGYSKWSEIIPVNISIILLYILYMLIIRYKDSVKENLYQYKNIAYLGIIIFLSISTINNIISIINYRGIYNTVSDIINSMSLVSFFLFPISVVTFILVTISNINLIRKEGKSLKNLLGLFLGIFLCVSTLLPDYIYQLLMKWQIVNIYNLNGPGPYVYNFLEALVFLSISYLECVLLGTIIIAIKSVKKKDVYNKDYMIILGCQINSDGSLTPLLKGRCDRAIEFRNKQLESTKKDLIFIPSGGKGEDEVISEGEAIKKYLESCNIDSKNIIVDNKSKNTYENMKFSFNLIKKKNANVGFSTTNYHVLRAGLIASEMGYKVDGIGSKTKAYFWINAFIREFIGTLYSEKKKHIIVILLIVLILAIMILITYFANNL